MVREISLPFDKETLRSLRAYDRLSLSGSLLVGRDQVHKRLCALLDADRPLPVDLRGQTMYYMGPAATPPSLSIGSCGPTTSMRMDPFTPAVMAAGLIATIGKGPRSESVIEVIRRYQGVYLVAFGGCGALYATKVLSQSIVAFEDLCPEALIQLVVRDFPVIVGIDAQGTSVFS